MSQLLPLARLTPGGPGEEGKGGRKERASAWRERKELEWWGKMGKEGIWLKEKGEREVPAPRPIGHPWEATGGQGSPNGGARAAQSCVAWVKVEWNSSLEGPGGSRPGGWKGEVAAPLVTPGFQWGRW